MRPLLLVLAFIGLLPFTASVQAGYYGYENGQRVWYVNGQEAEGGEVNEFIKRISHFRRQRVMVVIRVPECHSSCTLYSALIKYGLVCAAPGTRMVFHRIFMIENPTYEANGELSSFYFRGYASEVAPLDHNRFWMTYPIEVRREILKRSPSGLPARGREISIPATRLGIPLC